LPYDDPRIFGEPWSTRREHLMTWMPMPARPRAPGGDEQGTLIAFPASGRSNRDLVDGVVAGERWACAQLYDRFAPDIERLLRRLAGRDADLAIEDLLHDAFVAAYASIATLDDPVALPKWMSTIAARTAYRAIRRKRRRRWLRFWEPERLREVEVPTCDPAVVEAYRRTHQIVSRLPALERMVFTLRFVEGMELVEVAKVCEVSLATTKRHLARARERFERAAAGDDVLAHWLERGEA
jgi:RNA polymerase sigma-70 factor (ECF subfamily)